MEKQIENQTEKVQKTEAEWRQQLSDQEFQVTRKKGTEPAFTGKYWNTQKHGVFRCVCCGEPLFNSDTKYNSGTGWPSFYARSEEHTSELQSRVDLVCRLLLEKKKKNKSKQVQT